ncbi:hypothetical protein PoB_006926300 [Plakobranchus ocellatus]|uniref:Uncharacterized protein n=1 Tax=Plakobranchus ocellatus TaxID=259542 RepID=A0AAV4DFB7_9GAST|nr:hypothetical protein PoB_006926300 [Plakobranchus ocellatus]
MSFDAAVNTCNRCQRNAVEVYQSAKVYPTMEDQINIPHQQSEHHCLHNLHLHPSQLNTILDIAMVTSQGSRYVSGRKKEILRHKIFFFFFFKLCVAIALFYTGNLSEVEAYAAGGLLRFPASSV